MIASPTACSTAIASSPLPRAPQSVEDTGLPLLFLVELIAKILFLRGHMRLTELAGHLRLPPMVVDKVLAFMRRERLCEVVRRGETDGDVVYDLLDAGRARASEFLGASQYAGTAPVSLAAYAAQVERQSVTHMPVTREAVAEAFHGLVINPEVRDQVGAAMNSGRSMFLYGPAGSGKTYLAERLALLLAGDVAVPDALLVDGQVIQVFDPLVHVPVAGGADGDAASLDLGRRPDLRWTLCRRPVIVTGGELTLRMLDLDYDAVSGFYQAPPHLKANNGLFVVDDLGRQIVTPRQLMNRWIVPMDRRRDYLALHTGTKFSVPFDVVLVFSTNLTPGEVADEAFLRRLGYKIHVGPMDEGEYRRIFEAVCDEYGVPFNETAFRTLLAEYHGRYGRMLLACYPRDLVGQVRDFARYRGEPPKLSAANIDRAWHCYFATREEAAQD